MVKVDVTNQKTKKRAVSFDGPSWSGSTAVIIQNELHVLPTIVFTKGQARPSCVRAIEWWNLKLLDWKFGFYNIKKWKFQSSLDEIVI